MGTGSGFLNVSRAPPLERNRNPACAPLVQKEKAPPKWGARLHRRALGDGFSGSDLVQCDGLDFSSALVGVSVNSSGPATFSEKCAPAAANGVTGGSQRIRFGSKGKNQPGSQDDTETQDGNCNWIVRRN